MMMRASHLAAICAALLCVASARADAFPRECIGGRLIVTPDEVKVYRTDGTDVAGSIRAGGGPWVVRKAWWAGRDISVVLLDASYGVRGREVTRMYTNFGTYSVTNEERVK